MSSEQIKQILDSNMTPEQKTSMIALLKQPSTAPTVPTIPTAPTVPITPKSFTKIWKSKTVGSDALNYRNPAYTGKSKLPSICIKPEVVNVGWQPYKMKLNGNTLEILVTIPDLTPEEVGIYQNWFQTYIQNKDVQAPKTPDTTPSIPSGTGIDYNALAEQLVKTGQAADIVDALRKLGQIK